MVTDHCTDRIDHRTVSGAARLDAVRVHRRRSEVTSLRRVHYHYFTSQGMGLGGGNDGGVVASQRTFLVKVAVTEKKRDYGHINAIRFSTCALTSEPLRSPVACDELGALYNKDALIQYMIEKRDVPAFAHIRSLKRDVITVRATPNPAHVEGLSAAVEGGKGSAPFVCPISGVEANGQHGFVVFRRCGCMVADRAVREMGGAPAKQHKGAAAAFGCPACGAACTPEDVIKLCPTEEEADFMRARVAARRSGAAAAAAAGKAAPLAPTAPDGATAAAAAVLPGEAVAGAMEEGGAAASAPHEMAGGAALPPSATLAGAKRPRDPEAAGRPAGGAADSAAPSHRQGGLARAAPAPAPPSHSHSGSSLAIAASHAADEAIESLRASSSVYKRLLRPQGSEQAGKTLGQKAENLFIRTTTSIYTKNRGEF